MTNLCPPTVSVAISRLIQQRQGILGRLQPTDDRPVSPALPTLVCCIWWVNPANMKREMQPKTCLAAEATVTRCRVTPIKITSPFCVKSTEYQIFPAQPSPMFKYNAPSSIRDLITPQNAIALKQVLLQLRIFLRRPWRLSSFPNIYEIFSIKAILWIEQNLIVLGLLPMTSLFGFFLIFFFANCKGTWFFARGIIRWLITLSDIFASFISVCSAIMTVKSWTISGEYRNTYM